MIIMAYGFNNDKSKKEIKDVIKVKDLNFFSGTLSFNANEIKDIFVETNEGEGLIVGVLGFYDSVDGNNDTKFNILSYCAYPARTTGYFQIRMQNITNARQDCWFVIRYAYVDQSQ